jgi:hypothetical protein
MVDAITVPKMKVKATGTLLRHKDAYISILNFDIKGKRKVLAKARLNLSDYFEEAAEKDISFRLKLHPESSKISSASIDLKLRKSHQDPAKLNLDPSIPILADTPSHEIHSHCSTPSGLSQDLEKEPLIPQEEEDVPATAGTEHENSPPEETVVEEIITPPPEKNDPKTEPVPKITSAGSIFGTGSVFGSFFSGGGVIISSTTVSSGGLFSCSVPAVAGTSSSSCGIRGSFSRSWDNPDGVEQ